MATLIPALSTCVSRMTTGERRLAERLEQKLDDDYLLWYDVPVGPKQSHPDFVVLHPRHGGVPKSVIYPSEQARHYAHKVVDALCKDKQFPGQTICAEMAPCRPHPPPTRPIRSNG